MAVTPTGSASLRGVGPRAPRVTPGAFQTDIQKFANAATAPTRVAEVIGRGTEARRERGIKEATFDDRLATAQIQSAGDLAVAQPTEDLRGLQAGAAVETFGSKEELAAQNRMNELEAGKQEALEIANNIENLQRNEEQIREANRNRAATAVTTTQTEAVEAGTALTKAEGTPIIRFEDRPGVGRVKITESKTPTGEFINLGEETVATQAELDIETAQLNAAMQRAEAFMLQQERLNRGKTQPFINKNDFGSSVSVTVVTTAPDGGVSIETFPLNLKGDPPPPEEERGIEFNLPGAEDGIETLSAPTPAAPTAPAAPGPAAAPVTESGSTFQPTGESVSPYVRGQVGNLPDGTEVIYTGGDPLNPDNFKPIQ